MAALGILVLLAVAVFAPDLLKGSMSDRSDGATSYSTSVSFAAALSSFEDISSDDLSTVGGTSSAQTVT